MITNSSKTPYKHYWSKHSTITRLGRLLILGWSCPLCHHNVDRPYPYCPFCGNPIDDPDKED